VKLPESNPVCKATPKSLNLVQKNRNKKKQEIKPEKESGEPRLDIDVYGMTLRNPRQLRSFRQI
jgi:hypothetical protein